MAKSKTEIEQQNRLAMANGQETESASQPVQDENSNLKFIITQAKNFQAYLIEPIPLLEPPSGSENPVARTHVPPVTPVPIYSARPVNSFLGSELEEGRVIGVVGSQQPPSIMAPTFKLIDGPQIQITARNLYATEPKPESIESGITAPLIMGAAAVAAGLFYLYNRGFCSCRRNHTAAAHDDAVTRILEKPKTN